MATMMKFACGLLFSVLFLCTGAEAKNAFDAVTCNADVAKALIGKSEPNEPVEALEKKYKAIGLKDLGGDEISDTLMAGSWMVCGHEYMVIDDTHGVIRDAYPVPAHSRRTPEAGSPCNVNGKPSMTTIYAVLDNPTGDPKSAAHYSTDDNTQLKATAAWTIDEKKAKFATFPTAGLTCPRSSIITADGGP
jgi:hypothetical protein